MEDTKMDFKIDEDRKSGVILSTVYASPDPGYLCVVNHEMEENGVQEKDNEKTRKSIVSFSSVGEKQMEETEVKNFEDNKEIERRMKVPSVSFTSIDDNEIEANQTNCDDSKKKRKSTGTLSVSFYSDGDEQLEQKDMNSKEDEKRWKSTGMLSITLPFPGDKQMEEDEINSNENEKENASTEEFPVVFRSVNSSERESIRSGKRKSSRLSSYVSFPSTLALNKDMDETEVDFIHLESLTNKDKRGSAGIKTEKLIALTRNSSANLLCAGLERDQLEQLEKDFENADKNKDGYIDAEEFEELHRKYPKVLKVLAYHAQVSCRPPPIFTIIMAILQIIIYIIHYNHTPNNNAAYCSYLIMDTCRRGQIWRYITYAFVHAGHNHILFNILFNCMLGITLEMSQPGWSGKRRVTLVYFSGILLGSLGGSITNSTVNRFHAGSSSGVYALIAAYLASLILNWREEGMSFLKEENPDTQQGFPMETMGGWDEEAPNIEQNPELRPVRLHRNLRLAKFVFVISYVSIDTYIVIKNYVDGVDTNTGTTGHFMGFLGGLLMGLVLLKNWKKEIYQKHLKRLCLAMYILLVVILVILQGEGSLLKFPSPSNTTTCPVNCTYAVLINLEQTKCELFNLEAGGCFSNQDDSHF